MHFSTFDSIAILFVVASTLGYINHKLLRLPFAIGVMAGGLITSLVFMTVNYFGQYGLEKEIVVWLNDLDFAEALMRGMLGFLLFAGALHTDMTRLRKWAAPIFALASLGVLISTFVIGSLSMLVFDFFDLNVPVAYCFVFGALITPTDPVAVLGIMRAAGAPKDVEIKVVGESLFNDGVGVVLFTVLAAIAGSASPSIDGVGIGTLIVVEVFGGIGIGLIGGYITFLALRSLNEPNLETLISVSLVMGVMFVSFQVHASAPLACVVAGLFIGNKAREDAMDEATTSALDTVWSFIDEALNAILFMLVGFQIMTITFEASFVGASILIIVVGLSGRAAAVFFPIALLKRKLEFQEGTRRILWWGGIKGGISIALALSLPEFEGRDVILAVTYAVVIVSVLIQGLSIGKLIRLVSPRQKSEETTGH